MNPASATVRDIVDSLLARDSAPALVDMSGSEPRVYSGAELHELATRLSAGLAAAGIGRGDIVALLAENRPEWIAAALGVLHSGAAVLPIDSQLGPTNLKHLLEDSGARLVFTSAAHVEPLARLELAAPPRLLRLDLQEGAESWRGLLAAAPDGVQPPSPEDLAILFYTSGTTGPPKGVPLSHANVVYQIAEIEAVRLVHAQDRLLLPLPLHHVYPFVIGLLTPLRLGLPVILPKSLTGPEILRAISQGEATVLIGVPRLYRALLSGIEAEAARQGLLARTYFRASLALAVHLRTRHGWRAGRRLLAPLHRRFGPRLRLLASGGSALNGDLARRLEGMGWDIAIGYGLTETAPLLTLKLPGQGSLDSVGKPLPGVDLRLVPVAGLEGGEGDGAAGEVQVRGPNVFRGYWKLPDLQAEAFSDDGWFRTGDLGQLDEQGFLFLQGRASTVIVLENGKNVQPEEVEEVYAAHPLIAEIGILGVDGRLEALVIPDPVELRARGGDERAAVQAALAEQARKLPSYQRLHDWCLSREALPRTRLGKIQRHLLKERYAQAQAALSSEGQASRGGAIPLEELSDRDAELLADARARALWDWLAAQYPDVRLTPDSNLGLDLGIDSIEMINLTLEVRRLTGVELGERHLPRIETVRDLLHEVVHEAESGGGLDAERALAEPEAFLAPEQQRWLRPLGPVAAAIARGGRLLVRGLLRAFFSFEVEGLERLPAQGPFVLTPNHVSFLDPVALFAALPYDTLKRTFFAGWTGVVFKNAAWRVVARLGQTVPVDPKHAATSSLALGAAVLKRGGNLIWFPEGERTWDGRLKAFRPGIGLVLARHPVPAVPVHIQGAHEALPRGARWFRRHPVKVIFGAPVLPAELPAALELSEQERISRGLHDRLASLMQREDLPSS